MNSIGHCYLLCILVAHRKQFLGGSDCCRMTKRKHEARQEHVVFYIRFILVVYSELYPSS